MTQERRGCGSTHDRVSLVEKQTVATCSHLREDWTLTGHPSSDKRKGEQEVHQEHEHPIVPENQRNMTKTK